jgi:peptidoglycan/xylan/chitin deacetylase (PgdA/CDA1 family)
VLRKLLSAVWFVRAYAVWASGLLCLAKRRAKASGGVLVLTFHRVLNDEEFDTTSSLRGIVVRQRTFEDFLHWATRNFEIVDLGKGTPDWSRPASRPRMALTFDDGWLDNYRFAAPAAERHQASMTIFVCPGLMDCAFPFWPERVHRLIRATPGHSQGTVETVIDRMKDMREEERTTAIAEMADAVGDPDLPYELEPLNRTMTWDQVKELHQAGVRIGSHTVTHPILNRIPPSCVAEQLWESRRQIAERLGACDLFAYPNGSKSLAIRQSIREAGYRAAYTTEPGFWTKDTDPFLIPRVNVWEKKLIGPTGSFSRVMAEYSLFWRTPRHKVRKAGIPYQRS